MSHDERPVLSIDPEVQKLLDERGIQEENIQQALANGRADQRFYKSCDTGNKLAYATTGKTTYWVEYAEEGDQVRVVTAYSHRMKILEGFNMAPDTPATTSWVCGKCGETLEAATVKLAYLDETFAAELPACPSCQRVLISEENATTKMALAERMLEDK